MKLAASLLLGIIISIILFSCFQYESCRPYQNLKVQQSIYEGGVFVKQDPSSGFGYLVFDSTGTYLGKVEVHYKLVIYE